MGEKKGIRISKENVEFRRRLMETPGAEKLMLCYQCGVCTADCPVAIRVEEFRPRKIARLAAYGQKDRLLGDDTVWLCAGCYTCYERCPEQVRVSGSHQLADPLPRHGWAARPVHDVARQPVVVLDGIGERSVCVEDHAAYAEWGVVRLRHRLFNPLP